MPHELERSGWPSHLRPGAIRFAHASRNYDSTISFYRELVGLPVIGEFASSFGEDGTIFGFPDTRVQLEIIRREGDTARASDAFEQVVLYLDNPAAVVAATAPLRATGLEPESEQHPYWSANGAVTYRDPDGREVVFAPWVYGRDPEPTEHAEPSHHPNGGVRGEWYDGRREALPPLCSEAEDSTEQLDLFLNEGRGLVARRGDEFVGHLQLVPT